MRCPGPCALGLNRCNGQSSPRLCDHAREGHQGYIAYLISSSTHAPIVPGQADTHTEDPPALTDQQLDQVIACPHRREREACCGPVDYCAAGHFGGAQGRVMRQDCYRCIAGNWPRDHHGSPSTAR